MTRRRAGLGALLLLAGCGVTDEPPVRVFVCAQNAGRVEVYAADSLAPLATLPVGAGGAPHNVTFTPDGSRALVTSAHPDGASPDELLVVDVASLTITGRVALDADALVAHVVVTPDGGEAFVTGWVANKVFRVDLDTLTRGEDIVFTELRYPHGMRLAADGGRLYTANSENSVSEIDPQAGVVLRDFAVAGPAIQVAVGSEAVYASILYPPQVARIDLASGTVTSWPLPADARDPAQLLLTRDQRQLLVAEQGDAAHPGSRLFVLDAGTGAVQDAIVVGQGAHGLALGADDAVWVTSQYDGSLSRVDLARGAVTHVAPTGRGPTGIAVGGP